MSKNRFVNFVSRRLGTSTAGKRSRTASSVALIGVTLGLITIIITFAILNGFKKELVSKLFIFNSPVYISSYSSEINNSEDAKVIDQIIHEIDSNATTYASLIYAALLKSNDNFENIVIISLPDSVLKERLRDFIIDKGALTNDNGASIILSSHTAKILNVKPGDRIDLLLPDVNNFRIRKLFVSEQYNTDFTDYDSNIAFIGESSLKSTIPGNSEINRRINIEYNNPDIESMRVFTNILRDSLSSRQWRQQLTGSYYVGNAADDTALYMAWLSLLDTNVVVLIVLMILISGFTLICSMVIILLERFNTIAFFKIIGTDNLTLRTLMISSGIKIVLKSILLSNIISLSFILLQNKYHFVELNPKDYYLDYVPLNISVWTFICIDVLTIIIAVLLCMIPLRIIKRISPASIIRFQ